MTRSARSPYRAGSLGRRILIVSLAQAGLLMASLALVIQVTLVTRAAVAKATTSYIEEQAMADRIAGAVTRQLVMASASMAAADSALHAEFAAAGDLAYIEIRRYLFRDLTTPQRLQLEAVRERHQRMEVAAARALELAGRGERDDARAASLEMMAQGAALQDELSEFLRLRESDLHRIAARQAEVFRYLQLGVAGGALLLFAGIVLIGRYLYRRLATPLAELAAAAHRIGTGDLDARIEPPEEIELAVVAHAFNDMTAGLADARVALEERNRELESALERLWEAQATVVQTEQLSAMGRMMAGLAHELNNPMTSVLGYGQLALERVRSGEPVDDDLAADCIEPIVVEAGRARELIQTLLGFARPSDDSIAAVDLADAVGRTVRMRAYAFDQAGLVLHVEDLPDVRVRADRQRIQQTFLNVINNALDAMEPAGHGTLTISAVATESRVRVTFEDDGPGLAAPDRVFEPFYTTKPVGQGTGLGLSLAHRFMHEVGGSIAVENRPGGGARFTMTFLLATADDEAAYGMEATARGPRLGMSPRRALAGTGLTVLVVEDEAPVRELQRRLLVRLGARVLVAEHGAAARRILEERDVDLVVSDVKMPGGSGGELFDWVREHRPHLETRFLFVTGAAGDDLTARLADERPDLFIHKPFDLDEYLDRVAGHLAAAGGQRP